MSLQDDFKGALASWASGVSVVCTRAQGLVYDITVSSFSSLSFDPLLVLVCVANGNRMMPMIHDAGVFTVSVLAAGQDAASNYFARSGREPSPRFEHVATAECAQGLPVLDGALAFLSCELNAALVQGDHTIVVGKVRQAGFHPDREPLLYYRRRYRHVQPVGEGPEQAYETLLQSF